ncbi:MAG TPA: low affinity iron permease family protein [Pyrinomonadaceae bacterium]|nr:low affinity iron permease family protein [Pyrinomonadaceae bacterium]
MNGTERQSLFTRFSKMTSTVAGKPATFMLAVLIIVIWAVTGPLFKFSDTWQLVINTGTTIITFLMVFLIQNTQNRDALAVQLKLDELISSIKEARNEIIDVEDLGDKELQEKRDEMVTLAEHAKGDINEMTDIADNKRT